MTAILIGLTVIASAVARGPQGLPRGLAPPWVGQLQRMEEALWRQDLRGAKSAWGDAYDAARLTISWEGMIAVGEGSLRLGERTGQRGEAAMQARGLFQIALTWAQAVGSLDGVLRAAEAFADLGDLALADLALGAARGLAGGHPDPQAQARLDALQRRVASQAKAGEIL